MIKSMTGFASLTRDHEAVVLAVTVKSVNHRYLDVQVRAPQELAELEPELRKLVQARVARGRVELAITLRLKATPGVTLEINDELVAALSTTAERARQQGWAKDGLTAGDLLRFPQVLTVRQEPVPKVWLRVCRVVAETVEKALDELDRMRKREGEFLRTDLDGRCVILRELVNRIVAETETGEALFRDRLIARIDELDAEVKLEPSAIAQEVVRYVARSDIHEEITRLRGHLEHWMVLADGDEACGRKLDFLLQEMNREVNTVGSKAEGRDIGRLVISAKVEMEKLREQVQNIE